MRILWVIPFVKLQSYTVGGGGGGWGRGGGGGDDKTKMR